MRHTSPIWTFSLGAALLTGCADEPQRAEEVPAQLAEAAVPEVDPWPDAAVRELLAMAQADERVRDALAALVQSNSQDTAAFRRAAAEQQTVDQQNTTRLKELIRAHGLPSKPDVGSPGATAAFLIVQHAVHDVPIQKEYLAFVTEEQRKGQAPGEAVATLTDLTRMAEGQRQLYGTQITIEDGKLVVQPIEDEAQVDQRRAALGIGTLADYVKRVKQAYGIPE